MVLGQNKVPGWSLHFYILKIVRGNKNIKERSVDNLLAVISV